LGKYGLIDDQQNTRCGSEYSVVRVHG
jgi:hypothetical protein